MAAVKNKIIRLCLQDLGFLLALLSAVQSVVYLSGKETSVILSNPVSTLLWHAQLYTFLLIVVFLFVDTMLAPKRKKRKKKTQRLFDNKEIHIEIAKGGTVHQVSTGSDARLHHH